LCRLERTRMGGKVLTSRVPTYSDIASVAAKIANILMRPLQRQPLVPKAIIPKRFTTGLCLFLELPARKETEHIEPIRWTHDDALAGRLTEQGT